MKLPQNAVLPIARPVGAGKDSTELAPFIAKSMNIELAMMQFNIPCGFRRSDIGTSLSTNVFQRRVVKLCPDSAISAICNFSATFLVAGGPLTCNDSVIATDEIYDNS
jgi:hypothetical protein